MIDLEKPWQILVGNALAVLPTLPAEWFHCVVTSPPYFGLRDYQTGTWQGGSPECDHEQEPPRFNGAKQTKAQVSGHASTAERNGRKQCHKCGASRVDEQIGSERTPETYVENMVAVCHEIKRVLRPDGVFFLNIGDSYANDSKWGGKTGGKHAKGLHGQPVGRARRYTGLKQKDLVGIPWLLAKALRDPYYAGKIKNECDRVWLAATIDGEGSICGFSTKRKDTGEIRTGVSVLITNSNTMMLDEAYRIWKTSRQDHNKHGKGHLGKLDTWRWIAHDVDEKSMLMRELYPYLICKRKQCLLAYNFFELSRDAKRLGKSAQAEEVREKRSELIKNISLLNKMKPADVPSWCVEPPSLLESGWYLRSEIIWHKPNAMTESVTDRPSRSHEQIFLLTRSARYFYDHVAVMEPATSGHASGSKGRVANRQPKGRSGFGSNPPWHAEKRNRRTVWRIPTRPLKLAHFATFPPDLVKPCIEAGTSEKGCCPTCGAPWRRLIEKVRVATRPGTNSKFLESDGDFVANKHGQRRDAEGPYTSHNGMIFGNRDPQQHITQVKTIGWEQGCKCETAEPVPCRILDTFAGAGTSLLVASQLGRQSVGVELNPKYAEMARDRIEQDSPLFNRSVAT